MNAERFAAKFPDGIDQVFDQIIVQLLFEEGRVLIEIIVEIADTRTQPGLTIAIDPTPAPATDPTKAHSDAGVRHAVPATPRERRP